MGSVKKMNGVVIWTLALALLGGMAGGCAHKTPAQKAQEARLKEEKKRAKEQQKQAEARAKDEQKLAQARAQEQKKRAAEQQTRVAEQRRRDAEQQKRGVDQQNRDAEANRLAEAQAERNRRAADVRAGEERRAAEMKAVEQRRAEARASEGRRMAQSRADEQQRSANESKLNQDREIVAMRADQDRKSVDTRTREEKKQAEARMKEERKLADARAKEEKKAAEARKKEEARAAALARKRDREREKQFLTDEEEMHTIDAFTQAQAAAGAKADGMLFDSHFEGTQLNTAGQAKVNLMLQNRTDASEKANVYLALPENDANLAARRTSLDQYLQSTGLNTNVQVKSGENPAMRAPASRGLLTYTKTDSDHQGTGDSSGYTSPGMGSPRQGSSPETK